MVRPFAYPLRSRNDFWVEDLPLAQGLDYLSPWSAPRNDGMKRNRYRNTSQK
jgi:hypothetical protein